MNESPIQHGAGQVEGKLGMRLVLGGCVFLALALRLLSIEDRSLWFDEGYSMWFAEQPLGELFGPIARSETNPVLYYALLKVWVSIFGSSEFAVRSLSSVIGAVTTAVVYGAGATCAPKGLKKRSGIVAAIIFSLCFYQISTGQNARGYALLTLGVAGMILSLTRTFTRFPGQGRDQAGDVSAKDGIGLGCFAAVAMWSHYTAVFYIASVGAVLVFWWVVHTRCSRVLMVHFLASTGAFLILAWYPLYLFLQFSRSEGTVSWITPPDISTTKKVTSMIFGAAFDVKPWSLEFLIRAALFAVWPMIGVWAIFKSREPAAKWCGIAFLSVSIGVFGGIWLVSHLGKPIFLDRTVGPTQIGWLLLCSYGVMNISKRGQRALATSVMITAFSVGAWSYHNRHPRVFPNEDYREITRLIGATEEGNVRVAASSISAYLLRHYTNPKEGRMLVVEKFNGSQALNEILIRGGNAPGWIMIRDPDLNGPEYGPEYKVLQKHGFGAPEISVGYLYAFRVRGESLD